MTALASAANLCGMARKASIGVGTEQVNFRFKTSTVERMDAYCARHPLNPTLTRIAETAMLEWLDREEPKLPPAAKPPRK